jgi:ADP-ribose pyrophosphatase YjhB (NUDIX family)
VVLCRRAIEPRSGWWTLPAGFLENGETLSQGALRESKEEANLKLNITALHSIVDIPHINQVYMMYLAEVVDLNFGPGPESLETRLFSESEIPWEGLAFRVMEWTLKRFFEDQSRGQFQLHTGVIHPHTQNHLAQSATGTPP